MRSSVLSNELQVIAVFRSHAHTLPMKIIAVSRRPTSPAVSLALLSLLIVSAQPLSAADLSPETSAAFERYIRSKEALDASSLSHPSQFLIMDAALDAERKQAYARLQRGEILIEPSPGHGRAAQPVPGGLIHDWIGLVFVPSVSLRQALATLQNYARDSEYYRPQVMKSALLRSSGDDFHIFLRLAQTHGITLVFDTEYDVRYTHLDATHASSRSYSTRIVEVKNPGRPSEHEVPPADDRGFLWRLYSYWRFYEADGGVYVQCNAVSLTRNVPTGFGWMVGPFIEKIPRDSLSFTLDATRKALAAKFSDDPRVSSIEEANP
jgi:hypothetical protein